MPYRLHAADHLWAPPLKRDVALLLNPSRNPFFHHGEAEYFLAWRDGQVVGRIAAILNRLHNQVHDDRVGFFGFFETENDQLVADSLFSAAAEWLRARGLEVMRGPASFSMNDECGLLVHGFDTPPTIMNPHNPAWYPELVERAGFTKAKDLLGYQGGPLTASGPTPERLRRAAEIVVDRVGVSIRPLNLRDFTQEVSRIKELYQRCWEKNWGFVPMTDAEIEHLAAQFKPVVVPDLVPFIEKDGQPVAFALALPDLNVVLRKNRKGHLLPALIPLMTTWKRKTYGRVRIFLLGVVPEFRGRGLDVLLFHWLWTKAGEYGVYWGEGGWLLEDNPAINAGMIKMGFEHYKTYRMYDRPL